MKTIILFYILCLCLILVSLTFILKIRNFQLNKKQKFLFCIVPIALLVCTVLAMLFLTCIRFGIIGLVPN